MTARLSSVGVEIVGRARGYVITVEREATLSEDMSKIVSRRLRGVFVRPSVSTDAAFFVHSRQQVVEWRDALNAALEHIDAVPDIEMTWDE